MRSKAQRKRRGDLIGLVLIAAAVAVLGTVAAVYWRVSARDATDPHTMCPQSGPEGLTVFVVDATDTITAVQRASLHNHFEELIRTLPAHSAVELFTVRPVGATLLHRTGEQICNPGRESNFWTQNPRLVEERWRNGFWLPLQGWEEQVVQTPSATQSPILESLQSIAVSEFQAPGIHSQPRKLILVSDMLQNTAGLSQYERIESFSQFSTSTYYKTVRTDWSGVEIEILYITRPGTPQGRQHVEFWQQYFATSGGTLIHVTSL